ncbi:LLM class F420-dependent oxidoreductase [Frankia sp. QA3]|uniref:LLM class F420-dependent oxidoreductase n=1 Tax=Frankia sp. QA3 TaxID=710111 RepID=UPI000269C143|nr:LLM class F420-dependent oxidoreductase [Frankia sp. QA3]EIV91619.1 putative F420-dependent oxidoreductase, MSMEG_4141 family [Frankia sp. QA3]
MTVDIDKVGVWTPITRWPDDAGARSDAAAELDELGYGAVWIGGAKADLELPEALLAASRHLAAATGILNIWSEPAGVVADSYARVARSHPNRLLIGIGAGHGPIVGERHWHPLRAVEGYLDRLDLPQSRIPRDARVLAALGPRMLNLAAERTAGAHPYLVTPEHTWRARDLLGFGPLLAPEQKAVLTSDAAEARAIARRALALYLTLPNYTDNLRRLGFVDDDLAGLGSNRLVDALVAWGTVEAIRGRVEQHHKAGADHVAVQILTPQAQGLPLAQWRELADGLGLRSRQPGSPGGRRY